MPYLGELKQSTAYNINVDAGGVTGKKVGITIEQINQRDRLQSVQTNGVGAGARQSFTDTVGSRIDRVIIHMHPPPGGQASVEVVQGNDAFQQTCNGDTDLVFDAVP